MSADRLRWPVLATHITLLRGISSPDAPVLLTLFPPKAKPGEKRGTSLYYATTAGTIHDGDQALQVRIRRDWQRHPQHSLGLVVNQPLPQPVDWRPGTGNGAAWGGRNAHIGPCRWLFAECDRDGFGLDQQAALAERIYGISPTFAISTGNRSLHAYIRTTRPITPEEFRILQRATAAAYLSLEPTCEVDSSLCNPARVLRAAGGQHPRTGQIAEVFSASGLALDPDRLLQRLHGIAPPPPPPAPRPFTRPLHRAAAPAMEQILKRLERHPAYASGRGQREEFRRFAAGLRAAVIEAGGTDDDALRLIQQHSPGVLDAADYWRTQWADIHAGSFWFLTGGTPERGPDLDRIAALHRSALQEVGR